MSYSISGIDPIQSDDGIALTQIELAYEGLLQYHYLKRPFELTPQLAEAMPMVSADRRVYTFKIKQGVRFQDDPCFPAGKGRELTAEDFIYSWKRIADPKNAGAPAWIFRDRIAGFNEWHEAAAKAGAADYSKPMKGLVAKDRYTLQITLTRPFSPFLYLLTAGGTYAVPYEAVDHYGREFMNHPVGTGPYRLKDYQAGFQLSWEKNPTYRTDPYPGETNDPADAPSGLLKDAGRPMPLNDGVVFRILTEIQPQWLSFLSGEFDLVRPHQEEVPDAFSPDGTLSEALRKKSIRLSRTPVSATNYLGFNMDDPIVGKNKALRQAMSLAIDRAEFARLFYNGAENAAHGILPPGVLGYDSAFRSRYEKLDLERARALMKQAGYPDGVGLAPIEYDTQTDSRSRQISEYVQKSLARIGVKIQPSFYAWPEMMKRLNHRSCPFWILSWGAFFPDAEDFFQLFYSGNASPGSNMTNFNNPKFDRLFDESNQEARGSTKQIKDYATMANLLDEEAAWIPIAYRVNFDFAQPWVLNLKPGGMTNCPEKYLRVRR